MSNLSRRGFMASLTASLAAASAGPVLSSVIATGGEYRLEGAVLVLDNPLVIRGNARVILDHSVFIATDKFPDGGNMLDVEDFDYCSIRFCTFINNHSDGGMNNLGKENELFTMALRRD